MLTEIRSHLDERQWRLLLGAQARALGRGGIGRVARLAVVHPDTGGVRGSWNGASSLTGESAGPGPVDPRPPALTRVW